MSAPFIVLTIVLVTIGFALVTRNAPRLSSLVAGLGAFTCALMIFLVPIDQAIVFMGSDFKIEPAWQLLGRALVLDEGTQPMVGFLFLSGGFLLLPAWLARSSRFFPALALATIAAAGAALMARPFLYAAIFIEFAAIGGGLILVSRRAPQNLGALRLLILYTLAMLIILMTGWVLDQGSITSAATQIANRTTLALAFGVAILILVPPFHIWLINASQEANPYALSFVVLILQSSALFFLYRFLDIYPWLRDSEIASQALSVGGGLSLAVGVLFATSQRDVRKVLGYLIVADIGFTLLAIGAFTNEGYRLALGMTASRIVSLGVFSLGLSVLLEDRDPLELLNQANPMDIIPRFMVFIGMLSLVGFPLTAGFPGRWSLLTALIESNSAAAYFIVLAYSSLCVLALWWGYRLLKSGFIPDRIELSVDKTIMGLGVGIILLLGIFPQLTYPWVVELVSGLTRLFG